MHWPCIKHTIQWHSAGQSAVDWHESADEVKTEVMNFSDCIFVLLISYMHLQWNVTPVIITNAFYMLTLAGQSRKKRTYKSWIQKLACTGGRGSEQEKTEQIQLLSKICFQLLFIFCSICHVGLVIPLKHAPYPPYRDFCFYGTLYLLLFCIDIKN